jgi:hypothetical protein
MKVNGQNASYFVYSKVTSSQATNAEETVTLDFAADSEFHVTKIHFVHQRDAVGVGISWGTVLLTDVDTGRQMSNVALEQHMFAPKNGGYPLPMELIFPPNAKITAKIKQLHSSASTIKIAFEGYKVYNRGRS